MSSGDVDAKVLPAVCPIATHIYRAGLQYSSVGSGFQYSGSSRWGGSIYWETTSPTAPIATWASGGGAGGLAFTWLQQQPPDLDLSLYGSFRTLQATPVDADASLLGLSGGTGGAWHGNGTAYTPAATTTYNIINIRPTTALSNSGGRVEVQDGPQQNVIAFSNPSMAEWNAAVAKGGDWPVLLNTTVVQPAGTTYNIVWYPLNNVDTIASVFMTTSSEIGSQGLFNPTIDNNHQPGKELWNWSVNTGANTAPYFHPYYDPAATYQYTLATTGGVSVTQVQNSTIGNVDLLLPRNIYALVGGSGNWRGAWQPNTSYAVNDVLTNAGTTYIVTTAFTSGSSFSSADMNTSTPIDELDIYWQDIVRGAWSQIEDLEWDGNYGIPFSSFNALSSGWWQIQPGNSFVPAYATTGTYPQSFTLTAKVHDAEGAVITTGTTSIDMIDRAKTSQIYWLQNGDSFTQDAGSSHYGALAAALIPNVGLVGTRTYNSGVTANEGRGGAWLSLATDNTWSMMHAGRTDGQDSLYMFPTALRRLAIRATQRCTPPLSPMPATDHPAMTFSSALHISQRVGVLRISTTAAAIRSLPAPAMLFSIRRSQ